jgi:hypothetical protein
MNEFLLEYSPNQLLKLTNDSVDDFDRGGRIRVYKLCDYIEGILNGRIKIK